MKQFVKTHGTTFTVGLFLISTISGVFLFFHFQSRLFHSMHEWLSMVLLVPVAVHIWRNWAAFAKYFKKKTIYMPLLVTLIASIAFAYPTLSSKSGGGDPKVAAIMAIHQGNISQVAPLFQLSSDELQNRLQAKGYKINDRNQTLSEIAKSSDKPLGPSLIADVAFSD